MPTIEVLPNTSASSGQRSGNSSWYYSTAAPSQSVSAMPTAAELRTRKAKQTKDASHAEPSSKKDIAAQKRIAELEKVNWRDVVIKLPEKKASDLKKLKTANVRKIIASQKTFKNYLDDEIALHSGTQVSTSAAAGSSGADLESNNVPLPYMDAVASPSATNAKANRHFCEICGYWGSIRCMKCGTRACSGACLTAHQEARCTRQFA